MFRYMSKVGFCSNVIAIDKSAHLAQAEKFCNKSWFEAVEAAHGYDGRLTTAPHDPAPISDLILDSYQSQGLPFVPDMFTTGKASNGCGHAVRTIHQGVRTTSADFLDDPPPNLKILTKTYVDSVLFEERNSCLLATGVKVQSEEGERWTVQARNEVILAGGAYGSPAILMRSGVGPAEQLEKLGISSKFNLSGVGKNLVDHLVS